MQHSPAWARILSGVEADAVTSRAALATLPVTRKYELVELQKANRPLGGLTTRPPGEMSWVFASPGPIYEPGIQRRDYWRMGRALYAAGMRPG